MLSAEQQDEFRRCGILRVPGAVPPRDAEMMCDSVWSVLRARYGIRRDDPETWKAQRVAGWKDLPNSTTFQEVASPAVLAMLDDLLGANNWERPEHWGSLLVAFPESHERWNVPHQSWHLDAPVVRSLPGLYGVRIFTCLAKLAPGGGATLAVAGSHRLAQSLASARGMAKIRSADVRKALIQRYTWVKELCSPDLAINRIHHFMSTATAVEDVDVRVVEMTGEPGDIYLMHPVMLHAGSRNCADVPRIVLSTTVYQRGVDWSVLYGAERAMANQVN